MAAPYNDCLLASNPDESCRSLCSGYIGIHCCKHDYSGWDTDECWCGASTSRQQQGTGTDGNELTLTDQQQLDDDYAVDDEENRRMWRASTATLVAPIGDDDMMMMTTPPSDS